VLPQGEEVTGWDEAGLVAGMSNGEWETLLVNNPKVLWGLVADVVKAVKAGEGERRTGRRPAVGVASLDELYELLFPKTYVSSRSRRRSRTPWAGAPSGTSPSWPASTRPPSPGSCRGRRRRRWR
jgi:hypothetical protein